MSPFTLTLLVAWASAAALLVARDRFVRVDPAGHPMPPAPPAHRLVLGLLLAGGLALRAVLLHLLPVEAGGEMAAFDRACGIVPRVTYQAPLHHWLLARWFEVGEVLRVLGASFGLAMIRLPVLLAAGWSIAWVARIGRLAGAPEAGLGAAALLAFTPLALRVTTIQENYVMELLGALLVAERALLAVAWRAPVHRSLALAVAFAAWSGNLTAPAIGIAAAVVAVAFARERRYRELAYVVSVVALLLVPLAGPLWTAASSYFAFSVPSHPTPEELARIAEAARHPVEPVTKAFSQGRVDLALLRVSTEQFGDLGPLLLVAPLLLLAGRRWKSLPFIAFALAYPLLGTRILLNLQNYAVVLPAYALLATWGWDEPARRLALRPAGRRLRARAIAQVLLVGAGLWASHQANPLLLSERDDGRFFPFADPRPLEAALGEDPGRAVLLYNAAFRDRFNFYACEGSAGVCDRITCSTGRTLDDESIAIERLPTGRLILSLPWVFGAGGDKTRRMTAHRTGTNRPTDDRVDEEDPEQVRDLARLLRSAPDLRSGLLVVRASDMETSLGSQSKTLDRLVPMYCKPGASQWLYALSSCDADAVRALAEELAQALPPSP